MLAAIERRSEPFGARDLSPFVAFISLREYIRTPMCHHTVELRPTWNPTQDDAIDAADRMVGELRKMAVDENVSVRYG